TTTTRTTTTRRQLLHDRDDNYETTMRPLFMNPNQAPARSPYGADHPVTTGKNSCRPPAEIVDVDQPNSKVSISGPDRLDPRRSRPRGRGDETSMLVPRRSQGHPGDSGA